MAEITITAGTSGTGATEKNNASLATARANNAGSAYTDRDANNGCSYLLGATYDIYRAFMVFLLDDAALTGATITGVVFKCKPATGATGTGGLNIVETTQASPTALATSDHANFNTTRFVTSDVTSFTDEVYIDFTFNATGIDFVQGKIGTYAQLGPRATDDIDNSGSAPGPNFNWYGPLNATASNRPV